jgi:endonuclease YncB( thermonuclease family)
MPVLLGGLAVLCVGAPVPAAAGRAPCYPGHEGRPCAFERARVTAVHDGDTVSVRRASGARRRVRLLGVQARELRRFSPIPARRAGECHAVEATARLEGLLRRARGRVRMSSQETSVDGRGRLKRWLAVRRGGRWRDVGEMLLARGQVLWMVNDDDVAFNRRYNASQQRAAGARLGLFDSGHCGQGPHEGVPLEVWALSDPPGRETADGEWMRVRNRSATETLRLDGWALGDGAMQRYRFPAGTRLAPGAVVTVQVGRAPERGPGWLSWGLGEPIFPNGRDTARDLGDGVFLEDLQGDLRAWMLYPCLVGCVSALGDAIALDVRPRRPERIVLTNRGGTALGLGGQVLQIVDSMLELPDSAQLPAGGSLTVVIDGDPRDDSPQTLHLGLGERRLPDRGGSVTLMSYAHVRAACSAWGSGRCSP